MKYAMFSSELTDTLLSLPVILPRQESGKQKVFIGIVVAAKLKYWFTDASEGWVQEPKKRGIETMATAVSNAAKSLGMSEEVMASFVSLVRSVQRAGDLALNAYAADSCRQFSEQLLDELIHEYDTKL